MISYGLRIHPMLAHILQLPKKGVADFCLCQLAVMYVQMHVHKIFSLRIAVDTYITIKAACAGSQRDDQNDNLMNTLAFVSFLFVKNFPTLIRQYFHRQNFASYGNYLK